jgi:hypothetical protein
MRFSADEADKARAWNEQQRLATQGWEQAMSSTAYQRSVADMKAAGLNPLLGIASGGASTPSVSPGSSPSPSGISGSAPSPTSSAGSVGGIGGAGYTAVNALGSAINSGVAAARTMGDLSSIGQQIDQSKAQTGKIQADTAVSQANADNVRADTANKLLTGPILSQQLENLGLEKGKAQALINQLQSAAGLSQAQSVQAGAQTANIEARTTQQQKETAFFDKTGALPGSSQMATGGSVAEKVVNGILKDIGNMFRGSSNSPPSGNSGRSIQDAPARPGYTD